MKCRGKFKFKEIQGKPAGVFTNAQGVQINYDAKYVLKVDEKTDKGIEERTFKLPVDSPLVPKLQEYKEYSDIILDFDVIISSSYVRIVPTEIVTK